MKNAGLMILLSAAVLWMAGCDHEDGDKAGTAGKAAQAGPISAGGTSSASEMPEEEPVDMFAAPECVIDPAPDAACAIDVNPCGNASICGCPDGYNYDAALGKCILEIGDVGNATFVPVEDGECVRPASGVCTRDINACGQPSICGCEEDFVWNSAVGKCIRDLH